MAFDFFDIGWDDVVNVGKSIGSALDLFSDTPDYGGAVGEQLKMLQEQDMGFNQGGWDVGGLLGLGSKLYSGYKAGDRADDALARYAPLQQYYESMLPQLQQHYDPATARKGIRSEFERRKGMLTPYWEETDQARRARASQAGMTGSSTFGKQQAQTEAERAKILSGTILPQAEQAYYAQPTQMAQQMGQVTGLMTGQPMMTQPYQDLQRASDPWSVIFEDYIKNI